VRRARGAVDNLKENQNERPTRRVKKESWNQKVLGVPNIKNPQQQMFLLDWGLNHGYGRRWTCYRKIKGE
jgi:hypothetical protein